MAGIPSLSKAMEALVTSFNANQKWSSFGAAPVSGLPGGNVIDGRPEVATNARALTRVLGGSGGNTEAGNAPLPMPADSGGRPKAAPILPSISAFNGGQSPVSAINAARSVQHGNGSITPSHQPLTVKLDRPSVVNLAEEINKRSTAGKAGGKQPLSPMGKVLDSLIGKFAEKSIIGKVLSAATGYGKKPDEPKPETPQESWIDKVKRLAAGKPTKAPEEPASALPDWMQRSGQNLGGFLDKDKKVHIPGMGKEGTFDAIAKIKKLQSEQSKRGELLKTAEQFRKNGMEQPAAHQYIIPEAPTAPKLSVPMGEVSAETGRAAATTPEAMAGAASGAAAAADAEGTAAAVELAGTLGAAAGTAVGVASAFAAIPMAVLGAEAGLSAFASAVVDGNRDLAKWNSGLAIANAWLDVGNIKREKEMAGATSGTSTMLPGEFNKLADEFQPIAQELKSIENIAGILATEVARGLTALMKVSDVVAGPLLQLIEKYLGAAEKTMPMEGLVDFLENQNIKYSARDVHKAQQVGMRAVKPSPTKTPAQAVQDGANWVGRNFHRLHQW